MKQNPQIPSDFLPIVISSPSGAGKTTLSKKLLENLPELTFSVSHTTRKPRGNETDGKDYYFVEKNMFQTMVGKNAFLEWANVHENWYGTSQSEIRKAVGQGKKGIVFDVDHQGARQISVTLKESVQIFILPPNLEELQKRLKSRATDSDEVIQKRFQKAKTEIAHYNSFDYIIINDDVDKAHLQLSSIIHAERCKRSRTAIEAENLLVEKI